MKRFLVAVLLCLALSGFSAAQKTTADAPATKEDIQRYMQVTHSREMMAKMVDAMAKPMHDMVHQQYLKCKDNLPADFEARMNKEMDDLFKSFPWDEMLDAMAPVYQKHFTKGDVDALVAFYSGPTGQKMINEMPAIMAEAMESMMPLMQKSIDSMNKRLQDEIAEMVKQSEAKPGKAAPQTNN
jgi:hypothetical protein